MDRRHWLLANPCLRLLPLLAIVAVWEAATQLAWVNRDLVPPFSAVVSALADLASDRLWLHLGLSTLRAFTGLVLGVMAGSALGLAMAWWQPAEQFLDPLVTCTYPLPKPALIPVTMIWLGVGTPAHIAVVFCGCLLPVVVGAYHGARGVPPTLIWSARAMGTPPSRMLWRVALPIALPHIFDGIRVALSLAFVLIVAAEMVASRNGVGRLMLDFGANGVYNYLFAVILAVVAVADLADLLFQRFTRALLPWAEEAEHA